MPPRIGDAALEEGRPATELQSIFAEDYLYAGTVALTLLTALVALLVYLRGRRDLLYLWFAIFLLGAAALSLAPGQTLTLITDGVLEAQNATDELFGFDRLAALLATHPSA